MSEDRKQQVAVVSEEPTRLADLIARGHGACLEAIRLRPREEQIPALKSYISKLNLSGKGDTKQARRARRLLDNHSAPKPEPKTQKPRGTKRRKGRKGGKRS